MRVCGIDENGLGPFLGPLIITSFERENPYFQKGKVEDSKSIFSRKERDFSKIEQIFFKYIQYVDAFEPEKIGSDKIISDKIISNAVSLSKLFDKSFFSDDIKKMCPLGAEGPYIMCFSDIKLPVWCGEENEFSKEDKEYNNNKEDKGKVRIRLAILCPGILSRYVQKLGSKFSANAFFISILAIKSSADLVLCGKSGFKKSYFRELNMACKYLGYDAQLEECMVEEDIEKSIYYLGGKTIIFERDADTKYEEVATASLIGKYVREICMLSITRFISHDAKFPNSGYGKKDKLREKLVQPIISKLSQIGYSLPINCIERNY